MSRTRPFTAALILLLLAAAATAQTHLVVTAPAAEMFRSPSPDADVVSQVIFSADVVRLERTKGWVKIHTADDYTGWIRATAAKPQGAKPYASDGKVASVSSLFASLYREPDLEKHAPVLTIPYESRLEVTGEKVNKDGDLWNAVRLPDGSESWIQNGDLTFDSHPLSIDETIALARRFIGLPYHWGGTSSFGFDCSGFTQMLMRSRGFVIPRDTGPQSRWEGSVPVERKDLQPGDLIYFGKTPQKVNHTAMYIGDGEFINATRHIHPMVQIGRLDDPYWNARYISARRVK